MVVLLPNNPQLFLIVDDLDLKHHVLLHMLLMNIYIK